ncbi:hypothetical protein BSL78_21779 [Paramuricea clavata]|uniref:Uncharacterized protein n=1 Tax=Paramuricea clavata TaxID=317549 RepID=A0A7D9ILF7_PARCT|nr:hypothetical protein BSL78_21779 [Paramuricea clavata]
MRHPNRAILRERHITPTIDDLIHDLNGATVFSKLDLNSGYHQLELAPESRYITTFSTHKGLRRYTRLNFGTSSAAEVFQNAIQQVLSGIDGVRNVSDDIIIFGRDQAAHDKALHAVFERLRSKNLTLNIDKCEYNKSSIEFFGYVFSGNGVSPDPKKVSAIRNTSLPTNAHEVRSFLGMTNYCSRFIPNYSSITDPLRALTKSDQPWTWTSQHQQAFDQLKDLLTSDTVLAYFNPHKEATIIVDDSPVGLGAIFCQDQRIVAYASRSLTPVEQRYSQTGREALGVLFACHHFHLYIYGTKFSIITDHKPLERIFSNPSAPNARLERWALKLQPYHFTISYSPGKTNPADYLSRHPLATTHSSTASTQAEEYISFLANYTTPKAMTVDEVKQFTRIDPTLQCVSDALHNNSWHSVLSTPDPRVNLHDLKAFHQIRDELTVSTDHDLVLRSHRLILPHALRQRALHIAHEGHQGLTKTKQLLREKIWFPGIDGLMKKLIDNCLACQATVVQQPFEPLRMTELPQAPWQQLSVDFCGPLPSGDMLFVVIDEYSRYPEVEIVRSTSANTVIPKLDRILSTHGIPREIKSDNGPPFQSHSFAQFAQYMGFHHRKITPEWPKANSESERFMRTIQKTLRAAHLENKNWKQELFLFLRNYRATPHSTTGISPAELLFGRKLAVKLPEVVPTSPSRSQFADIDLKKKEKMKVYADTAAKAKPHSFQVGDTVLVRQKRVNKLSSPYNKHPYTIVKIKGSMITARNATSYITRNRSQFKKITITTHQQDHVPDPFDDEETNIPTPDHPAEIRRYPTRENRRPQNA